MSTGTEYTEDIGDILNKNIDTLTGSVNEYIDLVNKAIDIEKQKAANIRRNLAMQKAVIEHAKEQAEADKVELAELMASLKNESELSNSLVADLDANINKLDIENTAMQAEIERLASENKESLQEINELRVSNAKLQEDIDAKNAEIFKSTEQIIGKSEYINNLKEDITRLKEELASETVGNARLSSELKQKQEELEKKQEEIEQLQTFVEQQKRENNAKIRETGNSLLEITELYAGSEKRANKLQELLTAANQEIQAITTLKESEKQEQLAIIAGLEEKNNDFKQHANLAMVTAGDIANERDEIQKSYDSIAQTTLESTAEIEKLKKQLEDANLKIVKLTELVSAAKVKLTNNSGNSGDGTDDIPINIPIDANIPIDEEGMVEGMELPESMSRTESQNTSHLLQTTDPKSINEYQDPVNFERILRTNSGTPVNTSVKTAQKQSVKTVEDYLGNFPGIKGTNEKTSTINPMLERTVKSAQKQKSAETAQKQKPAETAQKQNSDETAQKQTDKTTDRKFIGKKSRKEILEESKSAISRKKGGGTKKKKYLKKHNSKTSKRKSKSTTKKIHKRFHKTNKHTKNNKRH